MPAAPLISTGLSCTGGPAGRVDQPDAEGGAGAQQPGVDERGAVVDTDPVRDPARAQAGRSAAASARGTAPSFVDSLG